MPSQAETPNPPRRRNPPRKSTPRHLQSQGPPMSADGPSSTTPTANKTRQPPRSARHQKYADQKVLLEAEATIPSTPPKSKPTNELPAEMQTGQAISQSSIQHNSTPRFDQRSSSMTPTPKNATPSQAYAGPTFHASPAASALPMPRFFSKSVPSVEKTSTLKNMMENETQETSSDPSPGSSPSTSLRESQKHHVREETPLDIFFQADRAEKARRDQFSMTPIKDQREIRPTPSNGASMPLLQSRLSNSNSWNDSYHSRNSSVDAVFSLDLDEAKSDQRPGNLTLQKTFDTDIGSARPSTAPSDVMTAEEKDRRARSQALKNMLTSPQRQSPVSRNLRSRSKHNEVGSVSPSDPQESPSRPPPKRILPRPSSNRSAFSNSDLPTPGPSSGIKIPTDGSPGPRPSSHLRKEVIMSPTHTENISTNVTSTPKTSEPKLDNIATNTQNTDSVYSNGKVSSKVSYEAPRTPPHHADIYRPNPNQISLMESNLKRMLKLDDVGTGST